MNPQALVSATFFSVDMKKSPVSVLKTYSPNNLKMGVAFGYKIELPGGRIICADMEDNEIIEALFSAYPGQIVRKRTGFIYRKLYDKIFPNFFADKPPFSKN